MKIRGPPILKHGKIRYRPKGKNMRCLKSMGSSKIGKACPSPALKHTKHFGDYFQNYYAHRPESWAYCFRLGLGRKIKRLDKTISAVIKIAGDSLFKRIIKLTKNTPTEKILKINSSHKMIKNGLLFLLQIFQRNIIFLIFRKHVRSHAFNVIFAKYVFILSNAHVLII
ncbi:hypothetical protein NQ317_002986 [Molorchus minor]|uniref:Uncharacterized protein n=1 Tax=Molorchus minor TaxID=1323400 RepID=A0ABQ9IX27_9CUCU|nr:hypothetical protein NQ317_002986 [Molorchus minor]